VRVRKKVGPVPVREGMVRTAVVLATVVRTTVVLAMVARPTVVLATVVRTTVVRTMVVRMTVVSTTVVRSGVRDAGARDGGEDDGGARDDAEARGRDDEYNHRRSPRPCRWQCCSRGQPLGPFPQKRAGAAHLIGPGGQPFGYTGSDEAPLQCTPSSQGTSGGAATRCVRCAQLA